MIFRKFRSINPYNNQLLKEFNFISEQEIIQKLEQSKQGYEINKKRTFIERRRIFEKLDNIINEKKKELSQLICLETGKNIEQCYEEIKESSFYLKNIQHNMEKWLQSERVKTDYKKSMIEYKGIGSVFQIMSNQYPFLFGIRNAIDCISGGNSVVMRCGDSCALSGLALEEVMKESGLDWEFQLLLSDPQHSPFIISHHNIQAVSFTGTTSNARSIASIAATQFKQHILFLSTLNPLIIWHDANLQQLIHSLLKSKFTFNGQSCHSPKRIIVHNHILNDFIHHILISFSQLISGNPLNPQSQITVMSRLDLALKLEQQIQQAVHNGDKILIGGNRQNCFFEPTIIIVNKDSILMKEEVLGPVLVICPAEENEILEIANNNYGFSQNASFFSQNEKNVEKLRDLENSSLFINQIPSINEFKIPISSFKNSGRGIQGSKYSVYQYCNINSLQFNS